MPQGYGKHLTEEQWHLARLRYVEGESAYDIARDYEISSTAVFLHLKRRNIPRRTSVATARLKHPVNESAFDSNSEEAYYWVGFLMGDGSIDGPHHAVRLHISLKDVTHLMKFRRFLGCSHKITINKRPARNYTINGKTVHFRGMVSLSVKSQHLVDSLARYGVIPNKSAREQVIGLEMNRHFWRGAVDADGSVTQSDGSPEIMLLGSRTFCLQFLAYVQSLFPEAETVPRKRDGIWRIRFHGEYVRWLVAFLYGGATISLDRKQEVANKILTWTRDGIGVAGSGAVSGPGTAGVITSSVWPPASADNDRPWISGRPT